MANYININDYPVSPVLPKLLRDYTTGRNIIWATDNYERENGPSYSDKNTINPEQISGVMLDILQPRIMKSLARQASRTRTKAEVFTPAWVCCRMNDALDAEWFGRDNVFFTMRDSAWTPVPDKITFPEDKDWKKYVLSRRLEITCGEAPFLVSRYDAASGEAVSIERRVGILDRKLRIVNENTATESEWLEWAGKAFESTYGYEYQGDNLLIARINLLCTFAEYLENRWERKASTEELAKIANILNKNLWQMDGLKDVVPLGKPGAETAQITFSELFSAEPVEYIDTDCRIYDWRGKKSVRFETLKERKSGMKFDFVIGNPPYQEEQEGDNKTFATPVYHKFMEASYAVSNKVELIHPARFLFNAGSTPKEWNEKMLNDPHISVLHFEQDSSKIFSNTDIKGGVAITYRDDAKYYGAITVFSAFKELRSIIVKVTNSKPASLMDIIFTQSKFNLNALYNDYPEYKSVIGSDGKDKRFRNNIFDKIPLFTESRTMPDDIAVFGVVKNKRCWRYISRKYVDNSHENFNKWKVLVPSANGSGAIGEVLSTPLIGEPLIGYTQTFISIGAFDTEYEANACYKYILSRFARTMLGVLKVTQHNDRGVWEYVPLQDFTPQSDIDWSVSAAEIDQQLYRKYGLSPEEIDFIETKVKEMA